MMRSFFSIPCELNVSVFHVGHFGLVWNPESIMERKKNIKKNDFLMFGFIVKNIKENKI